MNPYVELLNIVMVYLLGVSYVATKATPAASALASVLGVLTFDFFFVPPSLTFEVEDVRYIFTFVVMLIVSLMISTLTARLKERALAIDRAEWDAQIEKMRSDILSGFSHDLRTPLASIEGSAGALLSQPELSGQSRQLASTIQDESVRMSRLVRNLLDMTRVQGKIDLDLDWYGLDELAANAIARTETLFEKPVKLEVAADMPVVKVDGMLMEQVFVNLLENAARYAGASAQVVIRLASQGDTAMVTLADDGPGFEPGTEDRVFERSFGSGSGFGLGLAICRSAVEAHGGEVSARNRKEGGAEIEVRLKVEGGAPWPTD